MKVLSQRWSKTKNIYLDWLSKTELKKIFSQKINYKKLSLWWLTDIYEKDALKDHTWFNNLDQLINNDKKFNFPKNINLNFEAIKLIIRFIKILLLTLFIKIFYKDNHLKKVEYKNCLYVPFSNLVKYKKNYLDVQYGLFSLNNKNISYALQLDYDFALIYNYFNIRKKLNKIPVNYFIVNRYLNFEEIFEIYFFVFKKFLILNNIIKQKNYFILNKKDCSKILKPLLLKSFFGTIQYSILNGISFGNLFNKKRFKNFINYLEFFPTARSVYYFLKKRCDANIISINHANYSDNMLAYAIRKSEFSLKNDYLNYSPSPDIFCTQGEKYLKRLKIIFPKKKTYQIGSLKFGMQDIDIKNKNESIFKKKFDTKKKIISIFTSIKDYLGIVDILNKCDLSNFYLILKPHPYYKAATLEHFKNNFKHEYHSTKKLSPRELIKASDFVLAGDSSLCYESLILGKINTLRLYSEKYHPLFDAEDEVVTVKDSKLLENYLHGKRKIIKVNVKKLIKEFFYKYDKLAHIRLKKILKDL